MQFWEPHFNNNRGKEEQLEWGGANKPGPFHSPVIQETCLDARYGPCIWTQMDGTLTLLFRNCHLSERRRCVTYSITKSYTKEQDCVVGDLWRHQIKRGDF